MRVDSAEANDFRTMVGDDHFERSLVDAAVNHVEAAFRIAFGDNLLKLQFTSRGHIVWSPPWLDASRRNLMNLMQHELVRIVGIRPVIDVPLDFNETVDVQQDPMVQSLSGYAEINAACRYLKPVIKIKRMKRWKRLTISFIEAYLPTSIFPWGDLDP
jgi:hypothetical protein